MLICILTKNVITSCSVTMMLFLHLEVKPLMTLTTVLYLSCALISGHLAMMLMELTKRRYASFLVVFNRPINILCRVSLFLSMALCLLLRLFVFRLLRLKRFSILASHFFDLVIGKILTSRLSLSKHLAHNLGNLLLLGKIGVFHNRRNASSRLLLLISKHLILCIYLVFRILA